MIHPCWYIATFMMIRSWYILLIDTATTGKVMRERIWKVFLYKTIVSWDTLSKEDKIPLKNYILIYMKNSIFIYNAFSNIVFIVHSSENYTWNRTYKIYKKVKFHFVMKWQVLYVIHHHFQKFSCYLSADSNMASALWMNLAKKKEMRDWKRLKKSENSSSKKKGIEKKNIKTNTWADFFFYVYLLLCAKHPT